MSAEFEFYRMNEQVDRQLSDDRGDGRDDKWDNRWEGAPGNRREKIRYEYKETTAHGKAIRIPEVALPYPELKVERENLRYARLLREDMAGRVSEFTAVSLYLYHHNDIEERFEETAELLEAVSIVEMRHMEMLAELIMMLGGDPVYADRRGRPWSARYVDYLTGRPCSQIKADIAAEKAAIEQYRYHISVIDDRFIKRVLERIILDEMLHLKLFTDELKKVCGARN